LQKTAEPIEMFGMSVGWAQGSMC